MNNRSIPKTSTFTICHERCDPEKWTFKDIMAFEDFIKTGNMEAAAHLTALGVDLVVSELHTPAGGDVRQVGWASGLDQPTYSVLSEAVEAAGDKDVTALFPVYVGKTTHYAKITMGDSDGDYSHDEFESYPTAMEAAIRVTAVREKSEAT